MRVFFSFGRWYKWLLSIGLIIAIAVACATPGRPEGGPQDRQAPKLDPKKYSTPNPSTNFRYNRVILTFDEWVKLQAASSKVVVSPPLQERPTIKVRNKSVVVEWKEALVDSTTYIINFGDAIQDITEGNAVTNQKVVFSTGPYLDSLSCSGQIIDAATRQPVKEAWVMLYRNLADSVPKIEKPFYFTQTNGSGNFKLDYIRKGRYQIFALDDKNNDYKYNLPGESIGFLDSTFVINDSIQPYLRLVMFQERRELAVADADLLQFGEVRIGFNEALQSPTQVRLLDAPSDWRVLVEQGGDSLHLWFDGTVADTAKLRFVLSNEAEAWQDTIVLSNKDRAELLEDSSALRWVVPSDPSALGQSGNRKGRSKQASSDESSLRPVRDTTPIVQPPKERLELRFTAPLVAVDSSQMIWAIDTSVMVQEWQYTTTVDSSTGDTTAIDSSQVAIERDTFLAVALPPLSRDSSAANALFLAIDSTPNRRYQLTLLPNAVQDFWGRSNGDTLSRVYVIDELENYGTITTIITALDSSKNYIVELLNDQSQVVSRRSVQDSSTITLVDYYLPTGPYTIRVSTDLNNNQRWDVGNYDNKQQPEPRFISTTIQLKAGWENAMEIDLERKSKIAGGGKKRITGDGSNEDNPPATSEGEQPDLKGKKKKK